MITYVNTVFVSNVSSSNVVTSLANIAKGKFIFWDVDNNASVTSATTRFKIGMGTGNTLSNDKGTVKEVKWSNIINVADIKGWTIHHNGGDTDDTVTINFKGLDASLKTLFAQGGKRIIVRLTFKDLPTRFRKWTESYEYVTAPGDTEKTIAQNIAAMINKEAKRARVIATPKIASAATTSATFSATNSGTAANADAIELVAMKYDDDNTVDSLNWANQGRFNVNIYYTDPAAEGWASTNKNFPIGVIIKKTPGKYDTASAKFVRDREAQAMGYDGILNRGEGTWPIIKPQMNTSLSNTYDCVTLEFENMYRTADDLFRKTKQTVEIYTTSDVSAESEGTPTNAIVVALATLAGNVVDKTIE